MYEPHGIAPAAWPPPLLRDTPWPTPGRSLGKSLEDETMGEGVATQLP